MTNTGHTHENLHSAIVDSIPDLAIVIGKEGNIQYTNKAWRDSGKSRECTYSNRWLDINYLDVCDTATSTGNEYSHHAALGIRQTIQGERSDFLLDYPCVTPEQEQWYRMRVQPIQHASLSSYVILHQDITEFRKYIGQLETQTQTDELTGIGNRRSFNNSLNSEWRRDMRSGSPISLLLLDIDEFKPYNDQHGHLAGDKVLVQIAAEVNKLARRPGDWAARYGGEEFALVLGNTGSDSAIKIARRLLQNIRDLAIAHASAAKRDFVSASIGLATMYPLQGLKEHTITHSADQKMYRAKHNGGDAFVV